MYISTFPTTPQIESRAAYRRQEHLRAVEHPAIETRFDAPITVRVLQATDSAHLARLAGRDSSAVPAGRMLGAEADGALVAAISLDDGKVLADPFRSSGPAVELLRLRLSQLEDGRRRRIPRLRRPRRTPRARGAIAASPPGAGGRLLQL